MQLGPDTYRVVASRGMLGGGSVAEQQSAMEQGSAHCAQQNKQFLAIGTYSVGSGQGGLIAHTGGGYQLDFRCLAANDPGLVRPTPTPIPNIVIEDQRKR